MTSLTSVRGRRTVEVNPVQRGHLPQRNVHNDNNISDISNAWESMKDAKRALNRAEKRATEAAMPLSASTNRPRKANHRPSSSYRWEITPTNDPVARVPVQEPSMSPINDRDYRQRTPPQKTRYQHQGNSQSARFGGQHHVRESRNVYARTPPYTHTNMDILGQGPTELSLDDSTEVRVLNDVPLQTHTHQKRDQTVEVSPGLKVNTDYIPAYNRIYGEPAASPNRTRQNHAHSSDRGKLTTGMGLTLAQIEELRRRVDLQRSESTLDRRTLTNGTPNKLQHKESDPVLYRRNGEVGLTGGEHQRYEAAPVRKVARAPPAPHYRGFNLPETHYRLKDGQIINEETMNRRRVKRGKHHEGTPKQQGAEPKETQPLQPSTTDNTQNKPSRKMHRKKAPKPSKDQNLAASKVSAYVWREGQKVVREALGPLRVGRGKIPHSPPTKDGAALDSGRSTPMDINYGRDKSGHAGGSSHGGTDHTSEQRDRDENDANILQSKLSSQAKDVLNDLHLNSSGNESDHIGQEEGEEASSRRPLSFIVEPRKPPLGRSKVNLDNHPAPGEPLAKVRHYDSREVRKYMVQQKNLRRKKQQDEARERREAEMRKRQQLQELYKKQKDNAKASRDPVPTKKSEETLDKTYSKPPSVVVQPRLTTVEGRRYPPRTQAMRKLDVTSSDKENKAFWTTSSSDTSSRSSPQTDITSQPTTVQATHPANQAPTGGDIVLVPVTEEGAPITVVGRQKVSSPEIEVTRAQTITPVPEEEEESPANSEKRAKSPAASRSPTSNEERLQALKATASALHSRLDNEVKKLALSLKDTPHPGTSPQRRETLHSPLQELLGHQLMPSPARVDRPLSPRHLTWHNQLDQPLGDRWAFSVPRTRPPGPLPVGGDLHRVSPFQTRHQRTLALEERDQVFTGPLPGVGSLSRHAAEASDKQRRERAATKIQAAYRGHSIRQKMKWVNPPRNLERNEPRPDDLSLSEGTISDGAMAEEDFLPEFQSLRTPPHRHVGEPSVIQPPSPVVNIPQSISNMLRTPSAFEPTNDGLSVIDIFTRRYQQAQRSLLASKSSSNEVSPAKPTSPSDQAVHPTPSEATDGVLARPTTLDYSDDEFYALSKRTQTLTDLQRRSPDKTSEHDSRTDTSSFQVPQDDRVVTGSEAAMDSGKSVHSSHSSTGTTASISAVQDGESSIRSPTLPATAPPRRRREVISSPVSLPLSPTDSNRKPNRSPQSDPGQHLVRRSPLGSNAYSSSDEEAPRAVRSRKKRGRKSPSSRKSPAMSPDTPRNFRPIASPVVPPSTSAQSPVSRPPLIPSMVGYSPGALQLKMASELNLLDMLDASSQQLAEMEHARTMALAHEESAALARVLQGRQQDYERQLQLLNLRSQQEVENARQELRDVREQYATTALEAQRDLVRSRQEATDVRTEAADRLLQTQAEASRITAEAARQLAEAQKAALEKPPPPPIDVSKLTADSVHAGVSAALEQQRLQQQELLKDIKNGYKSPPPPRRSLGIGVNLPERTSVSPVTPNRSPTPHYTEDFTHSSQGTTKTSSAQSKQESTNGISESLKQTGGSRTSSARVRPPLDDSIRDTAMDDGAPDGAGPVSSAYSLRSVESENDSSIHTDSEAKRTMNDSVSISEQLEEIKSASDNNSISFEHSASEVESVVDTSERVPSSRNTNTSERARGHSGDGQAEDARGQETKTPTTPVQDTALPAEISSRVSPAPKLTADYIRQQLEEERMRAHHQAALLNLREKALEDKTQAELQWLEYQKRQSKNSGDEEGLNLLRRKQRQLSARMAHEKEEIRILREAQMSASRKLQMLIDEQETIAKLEQSAQQSKARTRAITTPVTPHLTSFESLASEGSPTRSPVTSPGVSRVPRDRLSPLFGAAAAAPPDLSPAEKQAKALQSVKLNAKFLSKRAMSLRKRRKEAEELLAWKLKLDQEEEEVKKLEERVKAKLKAKPGKSSPSKSSPQLTTTMQESIPTESPSAPRSDSNSETSDRLQSTSSRGESGTSKSRAKTIGGSGGMKGSNGSSSKPRSKSEDKSRSRTEDNEVPEILSLASSIDEEIEVEKSQTKSKKSPGLNSSGEETVKDISQINDYTSESFESVDQTLTQVHTPSPSRKSLSVKSSPVWLSPRRRRPEPESGSESERSLSQTFSETASDQSDIEGRIRALTDSLKKRKIEADKLRKQQKRHYREKLKAQEASLKKQLETYDTFIDQTRKELVKEKDAHAPPLLPGAKPQIKHLSISETQRKRDQSHTRALRQRTASESSVEGGSSSVDISKKRSFERSRPSNRSAGIDEETEKDLRESQELGQKKTVDPTSRTRSLSGDSSVTEDISVRSLDDQSISDVSLSASTKSKEKPESDRTKDDRAPELDGSKLADESAATITPDHDIESKEKLLADEVDARNLEGVENRPESPEIPEEIPNVPSERSSMSPHIQTLDLGKEDGENDIEDKVRSQDESVKSSGDAKSSVAEELPQQSPRTESRTGSSSKRSPRTDPSYSEDFQESSMTIDIRESKSDTEDDISEHLSDRSTASGESQVSEKFVSRPSQDDVENVQEASVVIQTNSLDVSDHSYQREANHVQSSPEVTVSPQRLERTDDRDVAVGDKQTVSPEEIPLVDPLPSLPIGFRVNVDDHGSGVVRFKGHPDGNILVGVELDQPEGPSDGTYNGTYYFYCPKNHGVFVTPERVTAEVQRVHSTPSLEEDLSSNHSSVHTSTSAKDKSGVFIKFPDDLHTGEYTDDAESIVEEVSEGVTDDAALQKVIISTAEAVESFSIDRDEPEGIEDSPIDTPRGAPQDEEEESHLEARGVPRPELVERLADDQIREVVEESPREDVETVEKDRRLQEESQEESKEKAKPLSFLELITPPEGEETNHVPSVPGDLRTASKDHQVETEVNSVIESLVAQTVGEMIKLKESRDKKWNVDFSPVTPHQPVRLADLDKIVTLYTPDSAGTTPGDDLDSPLPDELFTNRVKVDSAISGIRDGDDATPRARPTSPIFGESGGISPQALCEKLEQLQALDQDIFGADIFGGQEWFDDDFGSMAKSKSIIKVPIRAADDGLVPCRSPSPEEPLPKYNEARNVELKKLVEEPFMAIPHNKEDVSSIMKKTVEMVHQRAEIGDPLSPLSPNHSILGSDTIGNDIESTSKKAYKRLVFDLARETYRHVKKEQETVSNPPWMKPKRRPRKFLFKEAPKSLGDMDTAVNTQALKIIGLGPKQMGEVFSKYAIKKKRDKVDEILIQELREEEQEWVDYDDDELSVKMQLTDSIFASLLSETATVISRIVENRLHRTRTASLSDSDIEF